jgi:hypothetical protein
VVDNSNDLCASERERRDIVVDEMQAERRGGDGMETRSVVRAEDIGRR